MCNEYKADRGLFEAAGIVLPEDLTRPRPQYDGPADGPDGPIFPNYLAPIIRAGADGAWIHAQAKWGLPTPQIHLAGKKSDPGVTNVRNTASAHWRRWLAPQYRCLVPFSRFAEFDPRARANTWFSLPPGINGYFAGITIQGWTSIRRVRDGETTDDLYAFLTCEPNTEVRAVHPKAMPVILTEPAEFATWMTASWEIARHLQRPLPDGSLTVT